VASDYVLLALITATDADHLSPQWCRMVTHLADAQLDKNHISGWIYKNSICTCLHHTPLFHYWNFSTRWIRYNGETLIEEMKCMGYPHRICPGTESPSFGTMHSALYIHGDVPWPITVYIALATVLYHMP
jgi:hypothetical protein